MRNRDLTPEIIGAAIKIHRKLGPGLLESAYEACLTYELERLGLRVERQRAVPLVYESVKLDCGFRADLVVEGRVAVELKCKEALDRKSTRLNSSHRCISYAVFCLKKKNKK